MGGRPVRPVGLVYVKDLVAGGFGWHTPSRAQKPRRIRDLLRRPLWVPARMKASELLAEFQRRRVHMALVANERGDFIGLVTMEDLLEELVGEIVDETDTAPPPSDLGSSSVGVLRANSPVPVGAGPGGGDVISSPPSPAAGLDGPWLAPPQEQEDRS